MKHNAPLSLAAVLVLITSFTQARAAEMLPSRESCEFYSSVESTYQCSDTDYLKIARKSCVKFLSAEPKLTPELKRFAPKVRLCLQKKLLATAGPGFCQDLLETAADSHVACYVENGFCELGFKSKLQLGWLMKSTLLRIFKSPWRQTAERLEGACQRERD